MELGAVFALYVCTLLFLLSTYYFVGADALRRSGGKNNSHTEDQIVLGLAGVATVLDVVASVFIVSESLSGGDAYLTFGVCFCMRSCGAFIGTKFHNGRYSGCCW